MERLTGFAATSAAAAAAAVSAAAVDACLSCREHVGRMRYEAVRWWKAADTGDLRPPRDIVGSEALIGCRR